MKGLPYLYAFLGGALIGAAGALLTAPAKGCETRARLKQYLREKGLLGTDSEIDALVEQLTTEIDD